MSNSPVLGRPAKNNAGVPGLLEPGNLTEQTSPLGAGTLVDGRKPMVQPSVAGLALFGLPSLRPA